MLWGELEIGPTRKALISKEAKWSYAKHIREFGWNIIFFCYEEDDLESIVWVNIEYFDQFIHRFIAKCAKPSSSGFQ